MAAQQEPKPEAAFLKVKTASCVGGRGRRRDVGHKLNNRIAETKTAWKLNGFYIDHSSASIQDQIMPTSFLKVVCLTFANPPPKDGDATL